jgi:H+/Cl- antiporter ClcA
VLLLLCKGIAYALCLGVFRGGAVFPAIFLGAASGVLAATILPGVGTVAALAIGMGAGAAVTGLPVTATVLVVLLLGDPAHELMPVVILATVTALVIEEMLMHRSTPTESAAAA